MQHKKLCFIGSAQSGKSTLIKRLAKDVFEPTKFSLFRRNEPTTENRYVNIYDQRINVSMVEIIDYSADVIVFVFDLSRFLSFNEIGLSLAKAIHLGKVIAIIGNKLDLRVSEYPEIKTFCEKLGLVYYKVSAKNQNLDRVLNEILQLVVEKVESPVENPIVTIEPYKSKCYSAGKDSKYSIVQNYRDYSFLIKVLLLGDSHVGKSSLLKKFRHDSFDKEYKETIGIEFEAFGLQEEGRDELIKIQCWDTAGSERYRTITKSYIRGASLAIVMFDLSDRKSFEDAKDFIELFTKEGADNVQVLVVGNKSDLEALVSEKDLESIANEYCQISLLKNEGLGELINKFGRLIREAADNRSITSKCEKVSLKSECCK